jgi:hypothetical protein
MVIARIYILFWALALVAGAVLYLTDSLSSTTVLALGFTVHALAGAGLLVVFPAVIAEHVSLERMPSRI